MADIKQAAKWMMEGSHVRRPRWYPGSFYMANGLCFVARLYCDHTGVPAEQGHLICDDLLADDWEIAK